MEDIASVTSAVTAFVETHPRPLIVILGPTASGKTTLSLELASKLTAEIVSADSRQVYRGMDVGTDKIKSTGGIPHHLIDVVNPDESFTLAHYKEQAEEIIEGILQRKHIPLLVGGTMLYIDAVVKNLQIPKNAPDAELRATLEKQQNITLLHQLRELDPECAVEIDANNKRRLVRALEYCIQTGGKFSQARKEGPSRYDVMQCGLSLERGELYRRIDVRIDQQMDAGLIEETKQLADRYGYDIPSMSSLGYRQIGMYLRGETPLPEAIQRLKWDTHAYARRQLTWWRKDKKIQRIISNGLP